MKIAILEYPHMANRNMQIEMDIFKAHGHDARLIVFDKTQQEDFYRQIRDMDAVLTSYVEIDRRALDTMRRCKVVSVQATGWNFVDDAYAAQKGVKVCAVGEYCTQEVADHTIALMLMLMKYIKYLNRKVQEERVWEFDSITGFGIKRIEGQTLGILGLGKIGKAVAKRAQAFGMQVIAYDPYIPREAADAAAVKLVGIDELLGASDVISVHMNLTQENAAFFTLDRFRQMAKRPFLLNVARGGVIDEDALVQALDLGLIRGAGLDVLASESPDLEHCRLLHRDNVVITPHTAFYSDTAMDACQRISAENIVYALEGAYQKVNRFVNWKPEG